MDPEFLRGQWIQTALYSLLAMVGGAMGYIMRSIAAGAKIFFWRAIAEATASGFVGVLVTLLCQALHLNLQWTGVVVGVCGWLGARATIVMLESVVAHRIGARRPGGDTHGTD